MLPALRRDGKGKTESMFNTRLATWEIVHMLVCALSKPIRQACGVSVINPSPSRVKSSLLGIVEYNPWGGLSR